MGILDKAISMKNGGRRKVKTPVLKIGYVSFTANNAAVRLLGEETRYDLRIVPEERLLVLCKDVAGVKGSHCSGVLFARAGIRRFIGKQLPRRVDGNIKHYAVDGKYIEEENIVVFDLDTAYEV